MADRLSCRRRAGGRGRVRIAALGAIGYALAGTSAFAEPASAPAAQMGIDAPSPAPVAGAQDTSKGTASPDRGSWLTWKHASGDWGGIRTKLYNMGIDVYGRITYESAGNTSGGLSKGFHTAREFNGTVALDLDKLVGLKGGKFNFVFTKRSGLNLSIQNLGNIQSVEEIHGAGLDSRIVEISYTQTFGNDLVQTKVGFAPPGNDFASSPLNCLFQNNNLCGHTYILAKDSLFRNYPTAAPGARLMVHPTSKTYIQAAVYRGDANDLNYGTGLDLSFKGQGYVIPVEIGYQPDGHKDKQIGNYKLGFYYDTSTAPDVETDIHGTPQALTGAPFLQHNGRWGAYALFDRYVFHEAGSKTRGLTITGTLGYADPRTAKYTISGDLGLVYQGSFAHRDSDYIGAVVSFVHVNDRLADHEREDLLAKPAGQQPQGTETVIELDYGAQLANWLLLRPDFQYVIKPSGTGKIPNATVFGFTIKATI